MNDLTEIQKHIKDNEKHFARRILPLLREKMAIENLIYDFKSAEETKKEIKKMEEIISE